MAAHCPICKREVKTKGNPHRPFCSERCRMIDLDNWLSGRYTISTPVARRWGEDQQTSAPDSAEGNFD